MLVDTAFMIDDLSTNVEPVQPGIVFLTIWSSTDYPFILVLFSALPSASEEMRKPSRFL